MRRRRCLTFLGLAALAAGLPACAMAGKRPYGAVRTESATKAGDEDGGRERWKVPDWEAWQRRHARELARLSGETRAQPGPAVTDPSPTTPGPAPRRRPVARPAPPPDAPQSGTGGTHVSGQQPLRCRRICRHVRAICHAAVRICRIAERLNDPPSQQACQRGRARCTDARALARRTCAPCGITGRRSRCSRRRYASWWRRLLWLRQVH